MENVDHKELGRLLNLFSFNTKVPGTAYWHPKGTVLFDLITSDIKNELKKQGYLEIKTAPIIDVDTLKSSGHYTNYREKLFFTGNEKEMNDKKVDWCLKPMSCPGSIRIFNEQKYTYKDLPVKLSEFGVVCRYEQPGEVNGLLRTRVLTQDDAHVYCNEDQIEEELIKLINFIKKLYEKYGFSEIRIELSTRPEKSIGSDEAWEKAEKGLIAAMKDSKLEYTENPGDGAFYGPKIDFHIKDSQGRSWQMGTIQLDFATAEGLDATYVNNEGQKIHPVIIHRAILGSVERFVAILLESTGGALPTWLTPVQLVVLPISEKHNDYAKKIVNELNEYRAEINVRNESVGKKIREAELQKIPYILVVGDKEEASNNVTLRLRGEKDLSVMTISELKEILKNN